MYIGAPPPLLHFTRSYVSTFVKAGLASRLRHLHLRVETRYVRCFGGRNGIERLEAYLGSLRETDDSADLL